MRVSCAALCCQQAGHAVLATARLTWTVRSCPTLAFSSALDKLPCRPPRTHLAHRTMSPPCRAAVRACPSSSRMCVSSAPLCCVGRCTPRRPAELVLRSCAHKMLSSFGLLLDTPRSDLDPQHRHQPHMLFTCVIDSAYPVNTPQRVVVVGPLWSAHKRRDSRVLPETQPTATLSHSPPLSSFRIPNALRTHRHAITPPTTLRNVDTHRA